MARKQVSENKVVVTGSAAATPARRNVAAAKRAPRATATAVETPNTVAPLEVVASVASAVPSFEAISRLAYSYWEARGAQGGSPEQDWLLAEHELAGK
jgi:hypothetical protein